ncbi:MAG: PDZ domain-containing protein, partial [Candidatus Obscuribacterales bacterium]|nr:PDZ domain-containing protein [Candidatus Obscuribacterales bacterium]
MRKPNYFMRLLLVVAATVALIAPLAGIEATAAANKKQYVQEDQILDAQSFNRLVDQAISQIDAEFDGYKLYKEVFNRLTQYSIVLTNPDDRAKWAAQWEHKHEMDGVLDTEEGTDKAIFEMIDSLKQRFDYYNLPEQNTAEQEQFNGNFAGIGIPIQVKGIEEKLEGLPAGASKDLIDELGRISVEHPLVIFEDPFEGGPAEKAGLKYGDHIIEVDGQSVLHKTITEVVKEIRGPIGTSVKITVERQVGGKVVELNFDIFRKEVVLKVVKAKDLGDGITYIRLRNFSSRYAEKEMAEALREAAKGKAIVLDLRGNPGGRLEAVDTMGQFFIEKGTLTVIKQRRGDIIVETEAIAMPKFVILKTTDPSLQTRIWYDTTNRADLIVPLDMPVVVLVDNHSASASEILSGLLQ